MSRGELGVTTHGRLQSPGQSQGKQGLTGPIVRCSTGPWPTRPRVWGTPDTPRNGGIALGAHRGGDMDVARSTWLPLHPLQGRRAHRGMVTSAPFQTPSTRGQGSSSTGHFAMPGRTALPPLPLETLPESAGGQEPALSPMT